ncbi:hypothetical protein ACIPSE_40825 [Streptomyces sp. NPDC090106]|uniref:Rv1733c family protein n=1 Tax=Streptomyces sp. NPDC090106 TaxID=3365946 RepID=UPI003828FC0D
MAFRGSKVWLWRWRPNPLKRRADTVEAWVVLGAWLLTVLAGVFAGVTAAGAVEDTLAKERAEWRPVRAGLTARAPGAADGDSSAAGGGMVWADVRWTAPDGTPRTGQARVGPDSPAGTAVTVWTDPQGRLVTRPATVGQAHLRAALVGALVGVSAATLPFVGGRLLCGRLLRRRIDQWGMEWAWFGPLWGRGRTG